MNIVFLIIGLIVIYTLRVIAKNQVKQTKLLLEQFNKNSKTN